MDVRVPSPLRAAPSQPRRSLLVLTAAPSEPSQRRFDRRRWCNGGLRRRRCRPARRAALLEFFSLVRRCRQVPGSCRLQPVSLGDLPLNLSACFRTTPMRSGTVYELDMAFDGRFAGRSTRTACRASRSSLTLKPTPRGCVSSIQEDNDTSWSQWNNDVGLPGEFSGTYLLPDGTIVAGSGIPEHFLSCGAATEPRPSRRHSIGASADPASGVGLAPARSIGVPRLFRSSQAAGASDLRQPEPRADRHCRRRRVHILRGGSRGHQAVRSLPVSRSTGQLRGANALPTPQNSNEGRARRPVARPNPRKSHGPAGRWTTTG